MKVFVVGGATVPKGDTGFDGEIGVLKSSMQVLGAELAKHGHEIVLCSPFSDSADFHVLHGIAAHARTSHPTISIHYPETPGVQNALATLLRSAGLSNVRRFPCAFPEDTTRETMQYAWLLAQLSAMDESAGVIVVGGKPSGSMSLLLSLADARNKGVLPLTFLGGAARGYYDSNYWRLRDGLGENEPKLADASAIPLIPVLLETLLAGRGGGERTFFISYARARPQEADYVETLLRRRGHVVYRDEEVFEPSADTPTEISDNMKRAGIFVALWCKEYACSPWCFDEFEKALERKAARLADLWIFCLDATRMVPKAARALNYYAVDTREKLEGKVLFLLTKLEEKEGADSAG